MTSVIELVDLSSHGLPVERAQIRGEAPIPKIPTEGPESVVVPNLTKYGVPEPAEINIAPEPFVESTSLRRTRMVSSFFAFFLAGWKYVAWHTPRNLLTSIHPAASERLER